MDALDDPDLARSVSATYELFGGWSVQLLDGAEAKAYWGLALNYKPLQALVDVLVAEETINGEQLAEVTSMTGCPPSPTGFACI